MHRRARRGRYVGASRSHCETSGFPAAAAPTGNYGIDINIDTGPLGLSSASLLSAVQNLLLTPLWMAVVWAVHALIVMLQWAFTIDLLDGPAGGGLGRGLRQAQTALTFPWLALALSVASVLALYNGIVRRRVSDTLGQLLLSAAMVLGGMWVIADPAGTVGSLAMLANQTSLATLAVVAGEDPSNAGRVLGGGLNTVFATVVDDPWCYLEFGDVDWCRNPARLDRRLRAAALPIAASELALLGCTTADEPPRDLRAARQLAGGAAEAQRAPAARSAYQRCSVPRSARKRSAAQRDQRTRVAAAGDLRLGGRDRLQRQPRQRRRNSAPRRARGRAWAAYC